ncbi:aspartic peptidase domain-containing protein [Gilbertella persicaria]|uniref:aspartic peptidase domain-containing protein n=1 Tax=Gilbertella persicaria TaxID=101096 RepID=UPI00221E43E0|nr:aspartic peptidase domain-containing protein [Gilbertella persicaria]KAI8083310.1 aspartic peptidase domain-containing protein [Gilbertella persicaria]
MKKNCILSIYTIISAVVSAYPSIYYGTEDLFDYEPGVKFPCDENKSSWVASIGIGSPQQVFPLRIDTSTDFTWVAGITCHSDFCSAQNDHLFDAGKSHSITNLHKQVVFDYGNEEIVEANLYKDKFILGSADLNNFRFGKAFNVTGFDEYDFAGSIGLGASYEDLKANITLTKRAIYRPVSTRGRGRNARSISRRNNVLQEDLCEIGFGVDKTAISGDIAWFDIPTCDFGKSPFWKTKLTGVQVQDAISLELDTLASFDTTVKQIQVPQNDLDSIYRVLNAKQSETTNKYEFKCCEAKDLIFSFEKFDIKLPSDVWTTPTDKEAYCTANFKPLEPNRDRLDNIWRLGIDFLNNFFSVYSLKRRQTGLALLSGNRSEGICITSKE